MTLAIFDLDNTLIAGDSDHAWGQFLVTQGLVDGENFRMANDRFYEEYKTGTLNIEEYLQFSLKPLTQHSLAELTKLHTKFMQTCIEPMMLPKAKQLLEQHRAQGDFLLIITATNGFVTRPIADYLGVDDILTTDPEIINEVYTGKYIGTPTFQQGKVIRLNEWLQEKQKSLDQAYFYSDSINDLPLLEKVPNPIAVDPDEKLKKIAMERSWTILSLR
jgi:HAD superfamily hydrolase (TIGR01490 family)